MYWYPMQFAVDPEPVEDTISDHIFYVQQHTTTDEKHALDSSFWHVLHKGPFLYIHFFPSYMYKCTINIKCFCDKGHFVTVKFLIDGGRQYGVSSSIKIFM